MPLETYLFRQNNSGGFLTNNVVIKNPEQGFMVGHLDAYIHATSQDEANKIAESCGIYFDGVEKGEDCECCGDRWYRTVYPENSEDVLDAVLDSED